MRIRKVVCGSVEFKYQQVYKDLKRSIEIGELRTGEQLPAEEMLVEKYGVSRVTVRNALDELTNLGLIERIRGKGTFVKSKVLVKKMSNPISFTETNQMLGNISTNKVLEFTLIKAPPFVINYLNVNEDDMVWFARRIRYSNNLVILYEESYWLESTCGKITEKDSIGSILGKLAERGVYPHLGNQEFAAIGANDEIARYLEVSDDFPVLMSKTAFRTKDDRPMFLSVSYFRTDRITLSYSRIAE